MISTMAVGLLFLALLPFLLLVKPGKGAGEGGSGISDGARLVSCGPTTRCAATVPGIPVHRQHQRVEKGTRARRRNRLWVGL
jgi:hypothetical protein